MSDKPSTLDRKALSTFITDQRTLKAFEALVSQVSIDIPDQIDLLNLISQSMVTASESRLAISRLQLEIESLKVQIMSLRKPQMTIEPQIEIRKPLLTNIEKRIANIETFLGI